MIECGNVGSPGKLGERAIDLVDRMIVLRSLGAIEEVWKTCDAFGIVEAYIRNDDDLSTRRGVGCRECGRDVVKVVRERCDVLENSSLAFADGRKISWLAGGGGFKTCISNGAGSLTCLVLDHGIYRGNSRTWEVVALLV